MPNMTSFAVLNERVRQLASDHNHDTLGATFDRVALESTLNLNATETEEAMVHHGLDLSIDAICTVNRDAYICTFTYISKSANASNASPESNLDSRALTFQKILQKKLISSDVNQALLENVKDIWSLLGDGSISFHFLVASNKNKPTDATLRRFEEALLPFRMVDF